MQNVLFKIGINNDNSWPKIAVKRESSRSRIPYSRIKSRNLTFCALCEIKSIEKRPLSFSLSTSKIGKGGEKLEGRFVSRNFVYDNSLRAISRRTKPIGQNRAESRNVHRIAKHVKFSISARV